MNKTGAPKIEVNEDELPVDAIELLRKCGQPIERFTCVNIDLTGFTVRITFACSKGGAEALDLNPLHLLGCMMVIDSLDREKGELGLTMAMGEVKAVRSIRRDVL